MNHHFHPNGIFSWNVFTRVKIYRRVKKLKLVHFWRKMVILKYFKSFSLKNSFKNSTVITEETQIKGSSDSSHFIVEINVGKSRIRHRMTLNLNDAILNSFWIDLKIQFQNRSMSDPTLSDVDCKNKMAWV